MIYVTPKQAELLSYLTGRGTPGQWVYAARSEMVEDLGMSSSAIAHKLAVLVKLGLINRDVSGVYRVLRRLEDQDVQIIECNRPSAPRRKSVAFGPIRYAGYDARQAAQMYVAK